MQHKLEIRHPLLDENGKLLEAGWANEMILDFNRDAVKRTGMALKEWEYYLIQKKDEYAAAVTTVAAGPGRMITIHMMDYISKKCICTTIPFVDTADTKGMPVGIFENYAAANEQARLSYTYKDGIGYINASIEDFKSGKPVSVEFAITLPQKDLAVIVVPYSDPELFYYNCKACCMPVKGHLKFDGKHYEFSNEDSMAIYDWGRGIWEPVNQWYWSSASTMLNGMPFGFNIGHGFGDTSNATENMIFYNGVCHKLDQIEFQIPGDKVGDLKHEIPDDNYMKPWKFTTNDGRLDMDFVPLLDRTSGLDNSSGYPAGQHQVFGYFSGIAVLDDGTELPFKDVFGFAEKVVNVW